MTSVEVLVEIARVNEDMRRLFFHRYTPSKNARENNGESFQQLLFHDSSTVTDCIERGEQNYPLRQGMTVDSLNNLIGQLRQDEVLGVLSNMGAEVYRVGIYHLPMMDFQCEECPENLEKIEQFLKTIGLDEGVIMASGRSYHYYGVKLMNESKFLNFLGDCLLSELTDRRYIGHRLKDKCGILRISACPLRPKVPTVVSIL